MCRTLLYEMRSNWYILLLVIILCVSITYINSQQVLPITIRSRSPRHSKKALPAPHLTDPNSGIKFPKSVNIKSVNTILSDHKPQTMYLKIAKWSSLWKVVASFSKYTNPSSNVVAMIVSTYIRVPSTFVLKAVSRTSDKLLVSHPSLAPQFKSSKTVIEKVLENGLSYQDLLVLAYNPSSGKMYMKYVPTNGKDLERDIELSESNVVITGCPKIQSIDETSQTDNACQLMYNEFYGEIKTLL